MGRTDSRGRALVLLIAFAVIGSALFARLAYWQVGQQRAAHRRGVPADHGPCGDAEQARRHLRSVRRRGPRDDDRARAADRQSVRDPGGPARGGRRRARRDPGSRRRRCRRPEDPGRVRQEVHRARPWSRHRDRRPDPGGGRGQGDRGRGPRVGAGPGLPPDRRRPEHDARGKAPRLRQSRGRGPVRRRAVLPGHAGGPAQDRPGPARHRLALDPGHDGRPRVRALRARTSGSRSTPASSSRSSRRSSRPGRPTGPSRSRRSS